MSTQLTGLTGWVVDVMETLGGPGAALVVGLDNVFPPLPSELVLPLAGFTASQGTFTLAGALFWTTLGSMVGAVVVYLLGRWLGRDRSRRLLARVPLVSTDDFDRTEQWFARHGTKAVFVGRMVPFVRSLISLPAGIVRMPFWQFVALSAAGSLLWNSGFVIAGYLLGESWQAVGGYADVFQTVVLAVLGLAVVACVTKRLRDRSRERV